MPAHPAEPSPKKQSKWSPEEDDVIIHLRGGGMKWEDISKRLSGRSAISCRLHYQNYLERRCEWDEERKNKLARLYERFKSEMWAKVAEEMAVPWRAAEAMHWHIGENDMARRAGVVPFSLCGVSLDTSPVSNRSFPSHSHNHIQFPPSNDMHSSGPSDIRYGRPVSAPGISNLPRDSLTLGSGTHTIAAGRGSAPQSVPLGSPNQGQGLTATSNSVGGPFGRAQQVSLPSVAEMTTGMSPYSMPTYSRSMALTSTGPMPVICPVEVVRSRYRVKRRASLETGGEAREVDPRHC